MARNIETKISISSIESLYPRVAAIASSGPFEIHQDDTFFRCDVGRLKLRTFADGTGELIFYRRPNQPDLKESVYQIAPTNSPDTLRDILSLTHGQAGRVRKQRTLFLIGRTRVHLDRVEELGHFLELEVVLQEGEAAEIGNQEALTIMTELGILNSQPIADAYVDLLARKVQCFEMPSQDAGT